MNAYTINFVACRAGAIGLRDMWNKRVEAESPEQAVLKLYDEFDHIRVISINSSILEGKELPCVL